MVPLWISKKKSPFYHPILWMVYFSIQIWMNVIGQYFHQSQTAIQMQHVTTQSCPISAFVTWVSRTYQRTWWQKPGKTAHLTTRIHFTFYFELIPVQMIFVKHHGEVWSLCCVIVSQWLFTASAGIKYDLPTVFLPLLLDLASQFMSVNPDVNPCTVGVVDVKRLWQLTITLFSNSVSPRNSFSVNRSWNNPGWSTTSGLIKKDPCFCDLPQVGELRPLRMYCTDPQALVFMFNGGSSYRTTIQTTKTMKYTCIAAFWHPWGIYAVHP